MGQASDEAKAAMSPRWIAPLVHLAGQSRSRPASPGGSSRRRAGCSPSPRAGTAARRADGRRRPEEVDAAIRKLLADARPHTNFAEMTTSTKKRLGARRQSSTCCSPPSRRSRASVVMAIRSSVAPFASQLPKATRMAAKAVAAHDAGPEVDRGVDPQPLGHHLLHGVLPGLLVDEAAGLQRRRLPHDPAPEDHHLLAVLEVAGERQERIAQGGEDGLVGWPGGHRLPEPGQLHEMVGEEDVLLGGEVTEERPAGHVGVGGDIVHRHRVEAPLAEQAERGGFEFGGGQLLAALPQTGTGGAPATAVLVICGHSMPQ